MTDAYRQPVYAEDLEVGDRGPEVVVEDLTRTDFVRYAGASGDFTPTHTNEPYAKEAGYESVFAMGMLTAGFASHMVSDWLGIANVREFRCRFQSRVWPGDTITVRGEVVDKYRDDGDGVVDVEFVAENQNGEAVMTGDASAKLPSRQDQDVTS